MREEIYWRRGDWQRAAAASLALALRLPADGALGDTGARAVLDAAVAATLSGDDAALKHLRDRFGAAMELGEYRYPFRLMIGDDASGDALGDVRARAARAV